MATTIKLKNGSGAPLAGDLVQGEPALDLTNKRLYTENASGTVIEVGTNPTSLTTGTFTSTGIDDNATSTAITIDASENVGIGTTSPSVPLEVNGIAKVNSYLSMNNNGYIRGDASGELRFQGGSTATTFYDSTNISEHMRIDSSGNVGIGGAATSFGAGVTTLQLTGTGTGQPTRAGALRFRSQDTTSNVCDIYSDNGFMSFYTGTSTTTTEAMRIDASGNLLLNTTNEIQFYTSGYGIRASTGLEIKANDFTRFLKGSTEYMRIDPSGNVGIGTTSPSAVASYKVLQIRGGSTANGGLIRLETSDGTSGVARFYAGSGSTVLESNSNTPLVFGTNATERMRIDASGNVGIGTTAPNISSGAAGSTVLTVSATASARNGLIELKGTRTGAGEIVSYLRTFNNSGATPLTDIQSIRGASDTAGDLAFFTSNSETMRLDSSGNVMVGTTSASSNVVGVGGEFLTFTHNNGLIIGRSGASAQYNSQGLYYNTVYTFNSGASEKARFDSSGNLLVGRTNGITFGANSNDGVVLQPNRLDVSAASVARITQIRNASGTLDRFYNGASIVGTITCTTTTTTYGTSSDERLKENIVDAPAGNIDDIRVRSFDWKADGSHQTYGMVAQELVDVAPEAVSKGETEDDMWAVDYSKLVPMMIKEIQDLKAEVAALKGA